MHVLHDTATGGRAEVSAAATDVVMERKRQIERCGCTLERDDSYRSDQLVKAAIAYATSATGNTILARTWWPWGGASFAVQLGGKTRRESMVRAAALLLAEIERMDRATP